MSIVILVRRDYYRRFVDNLNPESGAIVVAASFALILGLAIIAIHQIWVWEPRVLVTLIAWIIVIKSVLWLTLPEKMLYWSQRVVRGSAFYIYLAVLAVVGILLMAQGYYLFMPKELIPGM